MKKLKKSLALFITLVFVLTAAFASASMVFAESGGEGDDGKEPVRLTYTINWDDNNNEDGMRPDEVVVNVTDGEDSHRTIFMEECELEGQENTWIWDSNNAPYTTFFRPKYAYEDPEEGLFWLVDHVYLLFYTGPHEMDRCPPGYYQPSNPEVRIENGEINYSVVLRHTSGPPSFEVAVPPNQTEFVYDGGTHGHWPTGGNGWYFPYATYLRSHAVEWEVGKYTTTIKPLKGYRWSDGTTEPKTINWEIKAADVDPIEVVAPTGKNLTYNGKSQTGVDAGEGYTLSGTTSATNAGSYQATATLKDGYVWSDGKNEPKTILWKINKATVNVTAPAGKTFTYNGKAQTGVSAGTGYSLTGTVKATNAGSYTAKATLKSDANYTYKWSDGTTAAKTIKWTINKAGNPLTIKAKTATVKYSAVKKKNQTLAATKVITFTKKGQGKMTYTKASGNKKITINKTTGKVTVKKGLKKGTYKVKVKVKAAGNANYKASGWKTVTIKIKIK